MKSVRITLSARDRQILSSVLAYMTSHAQGLGDEGKCLISIAASEILSLRNRILEESKSSSAR